MAQPGSGGVAAAARPVIYVLPPDALITRDESGMDMVGLWETLWASRWLIAVVTAIFMAVAVAYALLADPWYRAEVLLVPAEGKAASGLSGLGSLGSLGGLASLAGISVGSRSATEPLAVLTSHEFARAFIEDEKLLPILFSDKWDARGGRWKSPDPRKQPDIYDGIKYFEQNVLQVHEDKKTNLVTLAVVWKNRRVTADWANELVSRLNDRMRQRAQQEADASVEYLKQELAATNVVPLQQSIGRLLESELQKAMLTRVDREFAFRVIDRAEIPKWRSRPARTQVVAMATVIGLILSSLFVLIRNALRTNRAKRHVPASELQM